MKTQLHFPTKPAKKQRILLPAGHLTQMLLIIFFAALHVQSNAQVQFHYFPGGVNFDPIAVTDLAGNGTAGFANGAAGNAQFNMPSGVAADISGNTFVADAANNRIRKITPAGVVSTFAGSGVAGFANGPGSVAQFNFPTGVATDRAGNVYVADRNNNRIRKITSSGMVSTLAGSGIAGFGNGTGTAARFNSPYALCTSQSLYGYDTSNNNIYVADQYNNQIRKINGAGEVTTFAGTGLAGDTDGPVALARFNEPNGIARDDSGFVYVTQFYGSLRKINTTGMVSSIKAPSLSGFQNGLCVDPAGGLLVSVTNHDNGTNQSRLVQVTPSGSAVVIAGGSSGYTNAVGGGAKFNIPAGVALIYNNLTGNYSLLVADQSNNRIRIVTPPILKGFNTIEGRPSSGQYFRVSMAHLMVDSAFLFPPAGYELSLSAGSGYTHHPLKITAIAGDLVSTKVFIRLSAGAPAGVYNAYNVLFVSSAHNLHTVQFLPVYAGTIVRSSAPPAIEFDPITVSTLAGNGVSGYLDGTGTAAHFVEPTEIAVDTAGNIYVTDNNRVRKITPAGIVSTLAGNGTAGFANGTGTAAKFNVLNGIVTDVAGNVYVSDFLNSRIRKITPAGMVTTFAGSGVMGFTNGTGMAAQFGQPGKLTIDSIGNLYVSDGYYFQVRKITPAAAVTTFFSDGNGTANGTSLYNDGWLPEIQLSLDDESFDYVAMDATGNLYFSGSNDYGLHKLSPAGAAITLVNNYASRFVVNVKNGVGLFEANQGMIKMLSPTGLTTVIAGGNEQGFADGLGQGARFNTWLSLSADKSGNIYVADGLNYRIRKISLPTLKGFNTTAGTASSGQYCRVSGISLAGNEVVTAPEGYEISLTAGRGYVPSLSLKPALGDVASTQIYIRLSAGAIAGTYNGNLSINSPGAATQTLPVSGIIKAAAEVKQLDIYPNPNKGSFNLQLSNLDASATEVRILNQDGKIIYRKQLRGLSKTQTVSLNIGVVANGMYTVQTITNNKVLNTQMMIEK